MVDRDNITRRKALTATGGIGGAVMGIPSVAAGESENTNKRTKKEITEEEVERALAESEFVVTTKEDGKTEHERPLTIQSSEIDDETEIYVGKHKNAEVPTGKPFAIESFEEYLERDAPPGFESTDEDSDSMTTASLPEIPNFYFQEELGSISLAGHSVDFGLGIGGQIGTNFTSATAEFVFDLYAGPVSVTLFKQSIGLGVNKDGICFNKLSLDYGQIPGFTVKGCLDASFKRTNGDYVIGGGASIDACADPCKIISCEVCHGVGGEWGHKL